MPNLKLLLISVMVCTLLAFAFSGQAQEKQDIFFGAKQMVNPDQWNKLCNKLRGERIQRMDRKDGLRSDQQEKYKEAVRQYYLMVQEEQQKLSELFSLGLQLAAEKKNLESRKEILSQVKTDIEQLKIMQKANPFPAMFIMLGGYIENRTDTPMDRKTIYKGFSDRLKMMATENAFPQEQFKKIAIRLKGGVESAEVKDVKHSKKMSQFASEVKMMMDFCAPGD